MGLTIESPEADRLAREISERTGQSVDEVVVEALRWAIQNHPKQDPLPPFKDRVEFMQATREIQEEFAKFPVSDDRPADEILYDDRGLPH